tara:strand:+ start:425 stop:1120 length:696 start_codon:yes stop_codon:yes gene_type:complete
MSTTNVNYIKESSKNFRKNIRQYSLFNGKAYVYIKDKPIYDSLDIQKVIKKLQFVLKPSLVYGLDYIFIGDFDILNKRKVDAIYLEGAIYIKNDYKDSNTMVTDIIHEVAHCLEENFAEELYLDGQIEREFLNKREGLYYILRSTKYDVKPFDKLFVNTEYSNELEQFLFNDVGYERLKLLTSNSFISPYAISSINEYFASGFERYILGERERLQKISPALFNVLEGLLER